LLPLSAIAALEPAHVPDIPPKNKDCSSVQEVNSLPTLDEVWRELLKILTEAVHDLDADKLSEKSFHSFRTILQIGMEVTKERRSILMSTSAATWTASAAP
jgi:hypothetical protein